MGPGRRSGPPGCGQGVTGISCPLPRSPTSPEPGICPKPVIVIGGPSVHQPCIRRKAYRAGLKRECPPRAPFAWSRPAQCTSCCVWALLLSTLSSWLHWKEKMTKSVFFFFNEMLLLEAAQASLVIAMRGPQGAWAEVGGGGGGVWDGISRPWFPLCQLVVGQVEPFLNPESASTSPGAHWPPSHLLAQPPACVPTWWCWAPRCLSQSLQWA